MMKPPRTLCAVLLLLSLPADAIEPLRFCYEDVPQPPWSRPDGTGLNLELLKQVATHLNEQFTFLPMPWKRCIEEVRWGDVDAVIASSDAPERRAIGELPTLPDGRTDTAAALNEESYNVFLRAGSGASWDGRHFVIPHGSILVPKEYFIARTLRDQGYPVAEAIKSAEEGFRLLADGSVDIVILYGRGAEELAHSPRYRTSAVEAAQPYMTVPLYLLASRASYSREPARFKAIWNTIREVRSSAEYRTLEKAGTRHD